MAKKVRIAVILPVYRESPEKLGKCVSALLSQEGAGDYSVFLVIDKRSDKRTVSACGDFSGRARIVRTQNTTVSQNRNHCLRLEKSFTHFAFTDPDCVPEKRWLSKLRRRMPEGFSAIGGSDPFEIRPGLFNAFMRGDLESRLGRKGETYWLDTNNFFVDAKDFRELGGFSDDFTMGTDTFISEKLVSRGKRLFFDPSIRVFHMKDYSFKKFFSECFKYGKSHANIFLSGTRFSKTARTHPGVGYLLQPAFAFLSLVALPFSPFFSGAVFAGLFLFGVAASLKQKELGKVPFAAIFALRPFVWSLGGLSGLASWVFSRLKGPASRFRKTPL